MPTPDFENLADFFNTDEFAVKAILHSNGQTREIIGVFDLTPVDANIGASNFDGLPAKFIVQSQDVSGVERGDQLTIGDEAYSIRTSPKHDGTGSAILELLPGNGRVRPTNV